MLFKAIETRCPVCNHILGWRPQGKAAEFHCQECDVIFWWHPENDKPTNSKMYKKQVKCGCGLDH